MKLIINMSAKEKENVICPVCTSFEPQTWRKNLCKNCFHELDEHNDEAGEVNNETDNKKVDITQSDKNKNVIADKDKRKSLIEEKDQKKSLTDIKDKTNSKKATPEVPAKTSPQSSSKINENVAQKSKENLDQKQKSFLQKSPAGKLDLLKSENKVSDKNAPSSGLKGSDNLDQKQKLSTSKTPGKLDLTKSSFDKMSQGTSNVTSRDDPKKQTTLGDKNTSKDTADTKLGQKFETDKKPSSASVLSKSKITDSKSSSSQEAEKTASSNQNKKATDVKDPSKSVTPDSKFKKDDKASKVKQFAKSFSFSPGDDADDSRFNSLDRKKTKDKPVSPLTPPLSSTESKTGIKCQFPAKDEKAASGGSGVDKINTGSSATGSINKNDSGLPERKNVDLTKNKDFEKDLNKFSSLSKDKGEKDKKDSGTSEKIGRNIDKLFNKPDNNKNVWKLPSKGGSINLNKDEFEKSKRNSLSDVELSEEGTKIDQELEKLKSSLSEMEKKCKTLEEENKKLKHGLTEKEQHEKQLKLQKSDVENAIKGLQNQLSSMESRCSKLDTDNATLIDKLKQQHEQQEKMSTTMNAEEMKLMEEQVQKSENDCLDLNEENEILKQEIQDLKAEMDEMYDNFRDQEAEEFRELQRDLEITSKNCRVLQFKLRKAERKSEQVEKDRDQIEEKLKMLQSSFNSEDARSHIESLEEELRMAKEVSVRLHDQLDLIEDKSNKMDEENQHLTRLLEMSDKKQFRLEMEIDKLRDQIMDMREKMKDKSQPTTPSDDITERKYFEGLLTNFNILTSKLAYTTEEVRPLVYNTKQKYEEDGEK
ncbi:hypothetical protein KUTeg_000632 [Tegillarca granosa]|uniref:Uncharacterized protein n=1 Tax=Tegillarca granosa TaxID=220873 RepID=A0ABQ9FY49_TEGGR|nr:hypothetical protein KUTeg_000632 [Tegillarca granosa]